MRGGQAVILHGNALNLILPDESVDLIITSPPYFALRSYSDDGEHYEGQVGSEETPQQFLEALWKATAEMKRVLKPSGSIFVNLGDKYSGSGGHNNNGIGPSTLGHHKGGGGPHAAKMQATRRNAPDRYNQNSGGIPAKSLMLLPHRYAIGCVDQLGLILRAEIVWSKPNGLPESVTDRVRRSHEQWFHFTKSPHYFSAMDEIREPQVGNDAKSRPEFATRDSNTGDRHRALRRDPAMFNPLGKLPGSVWSIPSEPLRVPVELGVDHFAAFPQEWPRRLILGWSSPDGIILDPFGGTGTVAMVARALGRVGISVDLSHDYCRLAKWRIEQSGHGRKAISRTYAERQGVLL